MVLGRTRLSFMGGSPGGPSVRFLVFWLPRWYSATGCAAAFARLRGLNCGACCTKWQFVNLSGLAAMPVELAVTSAPLKMRTA